MKFTSVFSSSILESLINVAIFDTRIFDIGIVVVRILDIYWNLMSDPGEETWMPKTTLEASDGAAMVPDCTCMAFVEELSNSIEDRINIDFNNIL